MTNLTHKVFWETKLPQLVGVEKINSDQSAEVIIVGGGMAGLAAADQLSKAGKEVVILESNYIGAGASGKSSGMISQDSELELTDLIQNLGLERAKQLWEFVGSSMERMRDNIREYALDCDYEEQDYVFVANSERSLKKVYEEDESRKKLGYESRVYDKADVTEVINSKRYVGALRYPGTYGINSFMYAQGMKAVLKKRGVRIFEQSPAIDFAKGRVRVRDHTVSAPHILVCVDRFLPQLKRLTKSIFQVQTYIMMSKPLEGINAKDIFPNGNVMVCDSEIIYQYYRITGDNRFLLGGGDFLTTYASRESKRPEHIIPKLNSYLKKTFPDIEITPEYIWPGLLGTSKDLVPIAGQDKDDESIYYVAGATGLAWAAGLGSYMAEKIINQRDDYDKLFNPYRKFPFDPMLKTIQPLLTTRMTFGLSHAFVKYLRQIFG